MVSTNTAVRGLHKSAGEAGPKYAEYRKFLWVLSDWVAFL